MTSARPEAKSHQETGVTSAPVVVEVRRSRTDAHQLDVDVDFAADAEHVAEQAPVRVHRVGLRFAVQAHRGAGPEKTLRDPRRLVAVALRRVVDLRRVDLDETDAPPVRE